MVLNNPLRKYFTESVSQGRLIYGNAVIGARVGLYPQLAAINYVNTAFTNLISDPSKIPTSTVDFENCLHDLRFSPYEYGKPRTVNTTFIGRPFLNTPDLSGETFFTVMDLQFFGTIVSDHDKTRMQVDFPVDGVPKTPDNFIGAVDSLGEDGRRFHIADDAIIGRRINWFTSRRTVESLLAKALKGGGKFADEFCDLLGLGHHIEGTWLVLVSLPGEAIQAAGHYRPVFCDAGSHKWFMQRSSKAKSKLRKWGQTANLKALSKGAPTYDGGDERVAHQLFPQHFNGRQLGFTLLGPAGTDAIERDIAGKRLTQEIFDRRRR